MNNPKFFISAELSAICYMQAYLLMISYYELGRRLEVRGSLAF